MTTLTIPDDLYQRLQAEATRQQRSVEDVPRESIEQTTPAPDAPEAAPLTREDEMRRLRETLGEKLVGFDAEAFLTKLGIKPMTEDELDHAMSELPALGPSLSETIIQMRNEDSRLPT